MDEFDLIKTYFLPLASEGEPSFGLKDDVACWSPPLGHSIVLSKDIMVSGVHFFEDENPENIAKKLLRVNLSDLASSGARPHGYLLGLMLDKDADNNWLKAFARGLKADQDDFGITLFGGDTVKSPHALCLSLTVIGSVKGNDKLSRDGAKVGDNIYVTGAIGDAALGLLCLKGDLPMDDYLVQRLRLPDPRLNVGQALLNLGIKAAIDVSDGLLGDLEHILKASNVGAKIEKLKIPLSKPASRFFSFSNKYWDQILGGGDDYELLFTGPIELDNKIKDLGKTLDVPITKIGTIIENKKLQLLDPKGEEEQINVKGYNHFK